MTTAVAIALLAGVSAAALTLLALRRVRAARTTPRVGEDAAAREQPRALAALRRSLPGLGIGLASGIAGSWFFETVVPLLLAPPAGLLIPRMLARRRETSRLKRLSDAFADAVGLLASALRAGMSLPQGISVLSREGDAEIAEAFRPLLQEQRIGVSLDESLDRLSRRLPLPEIALFASAILVTRISGGNLAEQLDRLGETIRARRKIEGQLSAVTAQGRLSARVLTAMPLVLLVALSLIDPSLTAPLFSTPPGILMLVSSAALVALASAWLSRLTRIEA